MKLKSFFLLFILICSLCFPGCSEQQHSLDNKTIVDGDYEYFYISQETGIINPNDGTVYVDTNQPVPPPKQSGYIITRYMGNESILTLPTTASDGTPIIGIGRWAFSQASSLEELSIPNGYQYIFKYAFLGMDRLKSIHIASTVEYISGGIIFEQCNQLKIIQVDSDNPVYESSENCLLKKSTKELIAGCTGSVIPQGTLSIGSCAFSERKGPPEIHIPNSVIEIQSSAFFLCNTTAVFIEGQPQYIGEHAFTGCENTTIYCHSNSQPDSWHANWLGTNSERYDLPLVIWMGHD